MFDAPLYPLGAVLVVFVHKVCKRVRYRCSGMPRVALDPFTVPNPSESGTKGGASPAGSDRGVRENLACVRTCVEKFDELLILQSQFRPRVAPILLRGSTAGRDVATPSSAAVEVRALSCVKRRIWRHGT